MIWRVLSRGKIFIFSCVILKLVCIQFLRQFCFVVLFLRLFAYTYDTQGMTRLRPTLIHAYLYKTSKSCADDPLWKKFVMRFMIILFLKRRKFFIYHVFSKHFDIDFALGVIDWLTGFYSWYLIHRHSINSSVIIINLEIMRIYMSLSWSFSLMFYWWLLSILSNR